MKGNNSVFIDEALTEFEKRDGRLFIVEKSKSLAIEEVNNILIKKKPESLLCITESVFSAKELYNSFSEELGDILLIDSYETFKKAIGLKDGGVYEDYVKSAKSFVKKNKAVIIAEKDNDDRVLLHRKLCDNKSKNGVYNNGTDYAPFCVSDYLAECKFDFVVVNNVYELMSDIKKESDIVSINKDWDSVKPYVYDRIQLRNVPFYTEYSHSYRRLSNICHVATSCILISDLIIDGQVIAFYMALSLLQNDYSLIKYRDMILNMTDDYDADCDQVCTDVSFCRNDDDIIGNCIVLARQSKAKVSTDRDALQNYFETEFSFMSDEEIFTKMIWAYCSFAKKARYDMESIIETLNGENSTDIVARCFYKIFFVNDIKSEIERNITSLYVSEMSKEEVEFLLRLYKQYGIYHSPTKKLDSHVFMINRDDSGFEYYVNKKLGFESEKFINISVFGDRSDLECKCLLLSQIVNENKYATIGFPMLILANDVKTVSSTVKDYIDDITVYEKQSILEDMQFSDKSVLIMSAEEFKDISTDLKLPYVVIFDVAFDTDTFSCIIDKLCMSEVNDVLIFVTKGTLQGYLVNFWLEEVDILNEISIPPIDITGYQSDRGNRCESSIIIDELDEIYAGLKDVATGKCNESTAEKYAEKLKDVINEYTLLSSCTVKETKNDMKFLTDAGKYFNRIYKNLFSVGGNGLILEPTKSEKLEIYKNKLKELASSPDKKDKTQSLGDFSSFVVPEEEKHRILFFNVCSRLLKKTCDVKNNSCNGCEYYEKLKQNSIDELSRSVKSFFEVVEKEIAEIKRQQSQVTIISTSGKDSRILVENEVAEIKSDIEVSMEKIIEKNEEMCFVDYSTVEIIKKGIHDIYMKIVNKYCESIFEIMNTIFSQIQKNYKIVTEGCLLANKFNETEGE